MINDLKKLSTEQRFLIMEQVRLSGLQGIAALNFAHDLAKLMQEEVD